MLRMFKQYFICSLITAISASAGALVLEVRDPAANPAAKKINAALVARVTACHNPSKSVVTAAAMQLRNGAIERSPLKVAQLGASDSFAVVGAVPANGLIELAVTNPDYGDYQPKVLVRSDSHGIQLASARRFFGTPPTEIDIRNFLETID